MQTFSSSSDMREAMLTARYQFHYARRAPLLNGRAGETMPWYQVVTRLGVVVLDFLSSGEMAGQLARERNLEPHAG